jgi:hypothetical protein
MPSSWNEPINASALNFQPTFVSIGAKPAFERNYTKKPTIQRVLTKTFRTLHAPTAYHRKLIDCPLEIWSSERRRRVVVACRVRQNAADGRVRKSVVWHVEPRAGIVVKAEATRVEIFAARKRIAAGANRRRIADHKVHLAVRRAARADDTEIKRNQRRLAATKVGLIGAAWKTTQKPGVTYYKRNKKC